MHVTVLKQYMNTFDSHESQIVSYLGNLLISKK